MLTPRLSALLWPPGERDIENYIFILSKRCHVRGNPAPQEASFSVLDCDVVVVPPTHFSCRLADSALWKNYEKMSLKQHCCAIIHKTDTMNVKPRIVLSQNVKCFRQIKFTHLQQQYAMLGRNLVPLCGKKNVLTLQYLEREKEKSVNRNSYDREWVRGWIFQATARILLWHEF